jgi:hypothetical protein
MNMRPIDKILAGRMLRSEHGGRLTATAGGAGDNTATALTWLDRVPAALGPYHGAKLILSGRAVLGAAATLTLTALVRDATSNVGAGAADVGTAVAFGVVATGAGTVEFTQEIDVDLVSLREFVGVTVTGDLSAANTDTCTVDAIWCFYGSDRGPITKATVTRGTPA